MANPVYQFDFLENLTAIHFPSGGYIVVQVNASKSAASPPPRPNVQFKFGPNEKLLDTSQSVENSSTPASDTTITTWFVWPNDLAPFPTLDNFKNVVAPPTDPTRAAGMTYSQQFARFIFDSTSSGENIRPNLPGAFFPNGGELDGGGPYVGSGWFSNLEHAEYYATAFNLDYSNTGSLGQINRFKGYYADDGTIINLGPGPDTGPPEMVVVGQIDEHRHTPESFRIDLTAKYLIKVPSKLTHLTVRVTGSDGAGVFVKGYHGKSPDKLAGVPAASDTASSGFLTGTVTGDVTSELKGPAGHKITEVVVHGGGSGGSG